MKRTCRTCGTICGNNQTAWCKNYTPDPDIVAESRFWRLASPECLVSIIAYKTKVGVSITRPGDSIVEVRRTRRAAIAAALKAYDKQQKESK